MTHPAHMLQAEDALGVATGEVFGADALALAEQSAGIGVWSIDLTTGRAWGTPQYFRIMGLEPTSHRISMETVRALRHPSDRQRVLEDFRRALDSGAEAYEIEYRILRPDGELRWIFGRGRIARDASGDPLSYSGVDIDITERKIAETLLAAAKDELARMNHALEDRVRERTAQLAAEADRRAKAEARLHQAQKMEAVGQLTGGIAHDFNNILQVIVGNLEIAKRMLQREDATIEPARTRDFLLNALDMAQRASRNATQTVQRLLAFSRRQALAPTALDVNRLIVEMADIIGHTVGETIERDTRLAPRLWPAFADANQLQSALLNLIVNARDAMPKGGRLMIETANVEIDAPAGDDIAPGEYVTIAVADTGCGIAPDDLAKVFEPFYSTKDAAKGTGLGLSMVYGFVKQSGGQVRIQSELGIGTRVRLHLPRSTSLGAYERVPTGPDEGQAVGLRPRAQEGETVLVVEDYEDARRFGTSALEELGYRVLQAPDGPSALRLLDAAGAPAIDLLFTDVVLPGGMSGSDLAAAIRATRPGVPVLYTSGYTGDAIGRDGRLDPGVRLLSKPYALATLATSVRQAIDRAREAGIKAGRP